MDTQIEFLILYAEVSIAFLAFTTIVATVAQTFAGRLSPLQYLLFRFFVEVGLMYFLATLIVVGLYHILSDLADVWRIANYWFLGFTGFYLPYYITRRRQIDAPVPLVSLAVMIGYAISVPLLIVTAFEVLWPPSLTTTTLFLLWGMISNSAIFVLFLGGFVTVAEDAPSMERATP